MSDKLMETSPGGGQAPPYETASTENQAANKQSGQLGDVKNESAEPSSNNPPSQRAAADDAAKAERTAENKRYGEAISEGGMGGQTTHGGGSGGQGHALGESKKGSADDRDEEGMNVGG